MCVKSSDQVNNVPLYRIWNMFIYDIYKTYAVQFFSRVGNHMATMTPLYNRWLVNEVAVVYLWSWDQWSGHALWWLHSACDWIAHSVFALWQGCVAHMLHTPVLELPATQTSAILLQNGPSHLFQCCRVFLLSSQMEISVMCLSPTTSKRPLQSWSVCRWESVWMLDFDVIRNTTAFTTHTFVKYFLWFDSVSTLLYSGTPLRLEI